MQINKFNIILTIIALLIGTILGIFTQSKLSKPPQFKCPEVICPDLIHNCPPNVTIQQLDLDNIRKIKGGFQYSPTFSGTVIMKLDTTKIK